MKNYSRNVSKESPCLSFVVGTLVRKSELNVLSSEQKENSHQIREGMGT